MDELGLIRACSQQEIVEGNLTKVHQERASPFRRVDVLEKKKRDDTKVVLSQQPNG
jgi:hypothetical protein